MTKTAIGPDKVEHQFPDDTPDSVIDDVMAKTYGNAQPGVVGALKAIPRSIGEGIFSIPDLPFQAWALGKNAARQAASSLSNIPAEISAAYNRPAGELSQPPKPVAVEREAALSPHQDAYNAAFPPDPTHPWIRMGGNIAGPAIVEALATGGASIPATVMQGVGATSRGLLRGAGRVAATTSGTIAGSEAGSTAGKYGGKLIDYVSGGGNDYEKMLEEFGALVGGGAGGGLAPTAISRVPEHFINARYTDPDSAWRLFLAQRAGITQPSLGQVGNKRAAQLEDFTTTQPGAGSYAFEARRSQYEDMDRAAREIAAQQRGGPVPPGQDINVTTMGAQARNAGEVASQRATAAQNQVYQPIINQFPQGRQTVIPVANQLDELARMRGEGTETATNPLIDDIAARVRANQFPNDPNAVSRVINPQLDAFFTRQRDTAQANLERAQADAARGIPDARRRVQSSQQMINALTELIERNRGITVQNQLDLRGLTARDIERTSNIPVNERLLTQIREGPQTETLRSAAEQAGMPGVLFDLRNAEYGRLAAQQADIFNPLRNAPGEGQAYNQLFAGAAKANTDPINALAEHAPDELQRLMADQFEAKTRGTAAGAPADVPEAVIPAGKLAWWWSLPEETRSQMAGEAGPTRGRAGALMYMLENEARRPGRARPGAGSNTLSGGMSTPSAIRNITGPLFGGAVTGGVLGSAPGAIAGGVGGALVGAAHAYAPALFYRQVGRQFTNPANVQRYVHPRPWTEPADLSRILAGAVSGNMLENPPGRR